MSVLLGDRKESKFEAITYSIELHDMLILLMQRGFGVKDVDSFVRKKYAYGEISEENFAKYRELMRSFKSKINQCASLITSNVRAANTIYPRTMHEYETRRDYQNVQAFKSAIASSDILCAMRFYFQKLGNILSMITAHLSRGAEFHNRENDSKSISTNTTNYTEMTVIFYSVTFQSSMTILSMRLPNENC